MKRSGISFLVLPCILAMLQPIVAAPADPDDARAPKPGRTTAPYRVTRDPDGVFGNLARRVDQMGLAWFEVEREGGGSYEMEIYQYEPDYGSLSGTVDFRDGKGAHPVTISK